MEKYDEKTCRCALNRIFGFRPATAHALISMFGSAAGVFSADRKTLPPGVAPLFSDSNLISDKEYEVAEAELATVAKLGARFITEDDLCYPPLLKECPDKPLGLYIRSASEDGELAASMQGCISIVGTRDISLYGQEWSRRLVKAIGRRGSRTAIASGLAIGTDITVHRAALEAGMPTIAVLPCGIDAVYPQRHDRDATRIASSPRCAIITDYPTGTAPLPINFIRRNRIIAGMSRATVLIESKAKGGGMITARMAFSYDRDVFALPGRADDIRSQGCNLLIREKVAEPVISELSFTESLGLGKGADRTDTRENELAAMTARFSGHLDKDTIGLLAGILLSIRENRGISIEELAVQHDIPYRKVHELTTMLETDGFISVDLMQRCSVLVK